MKKRHFTAIIFCSWMLLCVDLGVGGYSPERGYSQQNDVITKSVEHPSLLEVNRQRQWFARLPDFGMEEQVDYSGYVKDEIIVKYKPQAAEMIRQEIRRGRGIRSGTGRALSSRSRSRVKHIEPLLKGFQANRRRLTSLSETP